MSSKPSFDVVEVTQQDINSGARGNPKTCPVALSMSAWHQSQWIIDIDWAYDANDRDACWELDPHLVTWIEEFDDGADVAPIVLVMDTELRTIMLQDSAEPC